MGRLTAADRRRQERQRLSDAIYRQSHPWCARCEAEGLRIACFACTPPGHHPREALCRRHAVAFAKKP